MFGFSEANSHTRPPLMRAGLERPSKAAVVTSQGLGSQCWSVSQDILDHPVCATPAGLQGDGALKSNVGWKIMRTKDGLLGCPSGIAGLSTSHGAGQLSVAQIRDRKGSSAVAKCHCSPGLSRFQPES